ncbi:MAG: VOC family protein [Candidatus Spyradocola sp.]
MKILGFDHVGICAKDPKAMADWYIQHLGFTLHSVGNGGNYFVESPDHILIEIMVPMKDHAIDAEEPAIGWKHIALVPEDFDAAVKEMQDLGVTVTSGPNYREDGYCTFFFLDPDGNIVHFAKWKDDRGMFRK